MIMCLLVCYPLSIHMSQLLSTGRPISSYLLSSGLHNTFSDILFEYTTNFVQIKMAQN